jgi:hypothetical protein
MGPPLLDAQLASRLVDRFSEEVMRAADLPVARANDIRDSCELGVSDHHSLIRLTCTITGSSYEQPWDGSETAALALADEAAESTAFLVARTPHYAWLRSAR